MLQCFRMLPSRIGFTSKDRDVMGESKQVVMFFNVLTMHVFVEGEVPSSGDEPALLMRFGVQLLLER